MKKSIIILFVFAFVTVVSACSYRAIFESSDPTFESSNINEKKDNTTISSTIVWLEPHESDARQYEINYLTKHKDEMESLSNTMLCAEEDNKTFQYRPKEQRLDWFNDTHYYTQGQIFEHPILDAASFLDGEEIFDLVYVDDWELEGKACVFSKDLFDSNGMLIGTSNIVYCTIRQQLIPTDWDKVLPDWYYYLEYYPD